MPVTASTHFSFAALSAPFFAASACFFASAAAFLSSASAMPRTVGRQIGRAQNGQSLTSKLLENQDICN